MKVVKVAGMFSVTLDVVQGGSSISDIDSTMTGCHNVVIVRNICTLPKQIAVEVSLPNVTKSVAFRTGAVARGKWSKKTNGVVAGGGAVTLSCPIERSFGPVSYNEPVQLDSMSSGDGDPMPLFTVRSSKIPFQTKINAV